MLKAFLISAVISKPLFTVLYIREQRKESLLVVAIHFRYDKTSSLSAINSCTKVWCLNSFWWKKSKTRGQHWQHRSGGEEASACAAGLWPQTRRFPDPCIQFYIQFVHFFSSFNSKWCNYLAAREPDTTHSVQFTNYEYCLYPVSVTFCLSGHRQTHSQWKHCKLSTLIEVICSNLHPPSWRNP